MAANPFAAQVAAVPFHTWFTPNKQYKITLADGSTVQGTCARRFMLGLYGVQLVPGVPDRTIFLFADGTRDDVPEPFTVVNFDELQGGVFVNIPIVSFGNPLVQIPIASLPISIDQNIATAACIIRIKSFTA